MALQKFMAAILSTLLVACSATRNVPPGPESPAGLARFVLVIQEQSDGQLTHAWQPAESFEVSAHRLQQAGRVVSAAAWARDCDQENQAYDDCLELERLHPQEFTAADDAVDWLKRHRQEVLVGSVITIAGVAFVVVSAGAGLLVLAPVVLMTSSEAQPGASVARGP
jgi:hypothetical protein